MDNQMIRIEHVSKQYRLGAIGGGTLRGDLQSWWARKRGREDPNTPIGAKISGANRKFLALDDVNLTVNAGERVGIIGHNGAGKSTLLKLLSRVTAPTAGDIYLNGRVSSMLEVGTGFHGELTGRENIYMNGAILGMSRQEIDRKIEDIIDFSECRPFIDTPVKRYSSGMYVRLAFAVSAHLDSEILMMDEVLAVGDMAFQKKCLDKMNDVSRADERTILYVSHNMNTIRQLCGRCVVLEHGRIIWDGGVEEAIGLYLGRQLQELPVRYALEDTPRPYPMHGKELRISAFAFTDREEAVYRRDEKVRFRLTAHAAEAVPEQKLYFVLYNERGESVGTAYTEGTIGAFAEGEQKTASFEFDIGNLAPGKYYFYPDLFAMDEFGNKRSYDHPMQAIPFQVEGEKPGALLWEPKVFGNVYLNPLTITDVAAGEETEAKNR